MQQLTAPHLSNTAAQALLNTVPEKIKLALIAYSTITVCHSLKIQDHRSRYRNGVHEVSLKENRRVS